MRSGNLGVPRVRVGNNTHGGTRRNARVFERVLRPICRGAWAINTDKPTSMALPSAPSSATQNKYAKRSGGSYKCPHHEEYTSNSSGIMEKRSATASDGLTEPSWVCNNMGECNK